MHIYKYPKKLKISGDNSRSKKSTEVVHNIKPIKTVASLLHTKKEMHSRDTTVLIDLL